MIELYPHQSKAVEEMHTGCILCGGVGTGKSITSLAYFITKECGGYLNSEKPLKHPKDLYIITTARKRDTLEWEAECSPFLLATKRESSISHTLTTIDSWNNIGKYVEVKNAFFIFDEQRVVGSGAWVKHFLKIARNNDWILLSATPGDTWFDYIPVFIANGYFRSRSEFLRKHVVFCRYTKYPKVERYIGEKRLFKLQKQLLVNMEYQKPAEKVYTDIHTDYDKIEYDFIVRNRFNKESNEPYRSISEICYALRRVVNSDPSRLKAIEKILKKKDRAIIFYNFDYELEILRKIRTDLDIPVAEWNGKKHELIPKGSKWAYLVQYAAGAEGWNCVKTDTVIFYSQSYSYRATVQAAGRIDRLNTQYKRLCYYTLISSAPIDKAIQAALITKENFNEKSLDI